MIVCNDRERIHYFLGGNAARKRKGAIATSTTAAQKKKRLGHAVLFALAIAVFLPYVSLCVIVRSMRSFFFK